MKAFTDLEQSKRLAEILPIESADMYYPFVLPKKSDKIKLSPVFGHPIEALEWYNKGYTFFGKESLTLDEYCVPCWSLAALLDVLPEGIIENYYVPNLQKENGKYSIAYGNEDLLCIADNPIDVCVEMIVKLKEKGLM